jgi:tetratricopeptide (TPR) repeat protein
MVGNVYADLRQADRAFVNAFFNRGVVKSDDKNQLDKAITDFSTAIELDPSMTEAYVSRAIAYGREDNHRAAVADFNTAIGREPDLQRAYFRRGAPSGTMRKLLSTSRRRSSSTRGMPERFTLMALPTGEWQRDRP